ncbi:hypothetical protein L5515_016466 [Caenorhabditis briggsae]|uniref:Uncharacterized protein n=1 Tax=Caenorhabditis briggsae TaxID=6238 RepID=A0AAE9FEA4_CAEBR|nr:hypothetical protein L5515_016466 [Caenorhabditis briggsae]
MIRNKPLRPTLPPLRTQSCWSRWIIKKLPSEHQDRCKVFCGDGFINPADPRLAHYGGLDAFLTQVKEFMNFPGSLEKFETELSTLYLMTTNIHSSLTNQKYIYKSQLLAILQEIAEENKERARQMKLRSENSTEIAETKYAGGATEKKKLEEQKDRLKSNFETSSSECSKMTLIWRVQ